MDNYTILITLIIILAVYAVFTIIISRNTGSLGRLEWHISAVFLSIGFFLILFQRLLPSFISVCVANYLLLLGFYFQTAVALIMDYKRKVMRPVFVIVMSLIYWILFPYFTYVRFNTSVRIIIISLFLTFIYVNASVRMFPHSRNKNTRPFDTQELYLLFIMSALFYTFRTLSTAFGMGKVDSLIDMNMITTISFIYIIVFNLINMMGIFNASLRSKNQLLITEKEKLSSLFGFLNDTARHLNLEDLYESIKEVLRSSMNIDTAAIYLIDDGGTSHSMAYLFNNLELPLEPVQTLQKGEGISGRAMEEDRVVTMDIDQYPISTMIDKLKAAGVRKLVSVPLKTADGIIGAISVAYTDKQKSLFLDEDFIYYLGEQIGLVLQNASLYEKVSQMANTDPLTGLYNRRRMMEILKKEYAIALRSGRQFTLVMADLDYFKQVNDNYGHDCGDEVLKEAANLFKRECRDYDALCRWGGEEFLLLFIDSDFSSTLKLAQRIRTELESIKIPCAIDKSVTLSMGLAAFQKDLTLEQIISAADDALYTAKKKGRNRIEFDERQNK